MSTLSELLPPPSARLTLRRLDEDDVAALFNIFSDAEVMRYWSTLPMTHLDEARQKVTASLEGYRTGDALQLGIEHTAERVLIGTCTLFSFHWTSRRAEIGYSLARAYWGTGYMNEALTSLIDHAFGALQLRRLEADIDPRNERSAKSLERLGFQREGYLRERWMVGEEVSDSALYGLLAREWRTNR